VPGDVLEILQIEGGDRGDRVRAGRAADQPIRRHQLTLPARMRYLPGICAPGSRLRRPASAVSAAAVPLEYSIE
jgi:hypothetical protein